MKLTHEEKALTNICMGYLGRISAAYLEAVFSKIDLFA